MTDQVILTPFPRLLHTVQDANLVNSTHYESFTFDNVFSKREDLIRAWGSLLHRYTLEPVVTFLVVDESTTRTVTYDNSTKIVAARYTTSNIDVKLGTAIGFGAADLPALQASMNLNSGVLLLKLSLADFPAAFSTILSSQISTIFKHGSATDSKEFHGLSILNCPSAKIDGPGLLHHIPDFTSSSTAMEFYNKDSSVSTMTYKELNRLSSILARAVFARSVTESKIVPILIPQGRAMYVGVLGVLRAGKAFCPVAPDDTPRDRIKFIFEDTKADVVLVTNESADLVVGMGIQTIVVQLEDLEGEEHDDFEDDKVIGDDVAYCMFTSGSTGWPKGVLVTHTNATQAILAHTFVPPFQRFLNFASLTFDVSVLEIFLPWYRGATLVSAYRPLLLSDLTNVINRMQVDSVELTPTVASLLKHDEVPTLRVVMTIGENLTADVIQQFGTPGLLYNTYGPTEATIQCTAAVDGTSKDFVEGDVGAPLTTAGVIIADTGIQDHIKPLPVGWVGELVVTGSQVAKGYLNRPELTESVFINDNRHGRCYRTGDLARILSNGRIIFIGRMFESQVKVRGRRIELGEIENVCGRSAVACVSQSRIVVVTDGDVDDARRSVERTLPSYMLPHKIWHINKIPLLASGKTDRKRIFAYAEELLQERSPSDNLSEDYASVVERTLAHTVKEVVGTLPGPEVSLRSIGIDSLGAMMVVSHARRILRPEISLCVADVLGHDTIRQISVSCLAKVTESQGVRRIDNLLSQYTSEFSLSDDVIGVYPTTSLQRSMLYESLRDSRLYSNFIHFIVRNERSSDRIIDGIRTVIDNNEILRTGFLATNDNLAFIQVVYADSRHLYISDGCIEKFTFHDMRFPPLRIRITRREDVVWVVDVVIHHAIYDGWAFDMFLKQLEDAIFAGAKDISYVQFREVMPYILDAEDNNNDFWNCYLRNAVANCIPKLVPPRSRPFDNFVDKLSVDIDLSSVLIAKVCKKFKFTAQSVFQLAWAHVLSGLFVPDDKGSMDVVFGTLISRRVALAGSRLDSGFGPMFATLPFRVSHPSSGITIAAVLEQISSNAILVMRHSDPAFAEVVKLLSQNSAGTLCSAKLGSLFAWQQSVAQKCENITIAGGFDRLEFEILLEVEPRDGKFIVSLTYHTSKLSKSQVESLLQQFEALATFIVSFIEEDISTITSVTYNDNALAISNSRPRDFNELKISALDLFDLQCEDIAIQILQENRGLRQISYRELHQISQGYASILHEHGIGHGDFVGVVISKSIELYAIITAIWSLGAVYVPVDIATPVARVNSIMQGAGVSLCCVREPVPGLEVQLEIPDYSTVQIGDELQRVESLPLDIAYVIFTSGSTGKPKGIVVSHNNLVNNILQLSELYPAPNQGSKMLQFCSVGFDVSIFEVVYSLHHHMILFSATKDVILPNLSEIIKDYSITHLSMTTNVASLLDAALVKKVECIVLAGEAMTSAVLQFWEPLPAIVIDAYGPSEMTNVCTAFIDKKFGDDLANIGLPFPNTSCFILAPEGTNILPIGAVGELAFGGHQVAAGYLNSPELTGEKFVDLGDYGTVYRTGDCARMIADGSIVFLGRMDQQVKIRGQRVELDEINKAATAVSDVKQCVTILVDERLVSFILAAGNDIRVEVNVRNVLDATLPAYMVPSDIIVVDKMPINLNGKIDPGPLTALLVSHTEAGGEAVEDLVFDIGTHRERVFADALVESVHNVSSKEIRLDTPILRYGLDSISAIRFIGLLRQNGFNLSISDIVREASIRTIVQKCKTKGDIVDTSAGDRKIKVFASEVESYVSSGGVDLSMAESILPCTAMQEALLGSHESYTNSFLLKLADDVDLLRLKSAWESVASSREILRTAFLDAGPNSMSRSFAQVIYERNRLQWQDVEYQEYHEMVDFLHSMKFTKPRCPYLLTLFSGVCGHYLCVSMHHSLFDGYALNLLLQDVVRNFSGHPIPRRTSVYGAIENIESVDTSHGVSFFADLLRGHEGLSFPKLSTSAANEVPALTCDAKLYSRISLSAFESAVKDSGSTVCPIVQTAWAKLLSLVTGTHDVVFGSVASGRGAFPGSDDVVGPIFSSYPVRAKLSSTSTNAEIIRQLEHLDEESAKYLFTPIREVQKKVATRQPGTQRLFDTMLILQYIRTARDGFDNEVWKCAEEGNDTGGLSIILEIRRKQKQNVLEYFLEYKRSLLDESQASFLLDIFDLILYDTTRRLHARVFDFTTFSTSEISISPAPTKLQAHGFQYLHSAFETNSIDFANHTALEFLRDDGQIQKWSYSELNTVAVRLASYLCKVCNVQVEDSLPTCVSKSPELYQSIIAALKVGAAFCPIDTSMPTSRISYMLQELQAKIILVDNASEECVTQLVVCEALDILVVNISTLVFHDTDSVELDRNVLDDSITAYRIFTSGTTGKPKAVEVEVRNAVQTILASKYLIPHNRNTRLLQYASPSFDMSIYDCFIAWSFGLTLCAADQQIMSTDLENVINKLGVTLLDLTPSVASTIRRTKIPSVECLYCIGEILPPSVVDEWDGACVNSYGPTEASMCCTMTPASKTIRSAIIGHPFPTVSFYILNPGTEDILPVLSCGELCIGGYQIARGYYRKEKLTTEKFIRLSDTPVFRTGDLGRMLTDGSIEFIGRIDDQVKLRGVRIELQEIDAVIRMEAEANYLFNGVCTLIMRQPTEGSRLQLVTFMAFKAADESSDCYTLEITESIEGLLRIARDACKSFLPDYMVPTAIIPISRIPLSSAGKVSKAQLQIVYNQLSVLPKCTDGEKTAYIFTETQARIREVFAAVSGVPASDIRPNTTLYQLGMDSISATQVASQLKRAGLQLTAIDVLKCLTIEKLDKVVKNKTLANDEDLAELFEEQYRSCILKEIGFSETDIAHVYPCTHTQEGILSQFQASAGLLYVNHIVFEVPASIAYDRLFEAWMSVFQKYDILRTGFLELDHRSTFSYAQIVHTNPDFQWTKSKISTSDNLEEFVDQRVGEYCQYFLSHLHLPQLFLECIDTHVGSSRYLLMTANHAIFDALLLNKILSDVCDLLSGADLTSRDSSYREVLNAILRLQLLATGDSGSHFWKNSLGTASVTRIPNLNPFRTDVVDRKTVERQLSLTYELLQQCCTKLNVSVQSAGAATWAKILSSYVGEPDIVFGIVLSGQTDIESASLSLFPCLTTVPFHVHVSGLNSELLQVVEQQSRAILEFQHTPHKFVRDIVGLPESLYDTIFLYQKVPAHSNKSDPWRRLIEHGATEYTCSLEIEPLGNGSVTCRLHYNSSVVPTEQANIILQQFDYILRELLIIPHRDCWRLDLPIDVLSIIPPKLDEIPSDVKLLHEFVERESRLNPEAIALEFATTIEEDRVDIERWSYAELNRQANKVANYILSTFAVRPNDKIVTCFEKSPEASFAFVGILKSGCSFLATDVTAPISRKRYIADDSGAICVLTHDRLLNELTTKEIKLPVVSVTSIDVSNSPDTPPSVHLQPENLCYCLYTSGSTGNPKGCVLTHENAVQGMLAFQRQFKGTWTKESRFLQFASFHFDVSVLEQFWSWSIGITVSSAPRDIILRDINLSINALGITHIDLTPSLAALIKPEEVPSLCRGLFITGGDLLNQEVLNRWGDMKVLYNAYGPTEVTIGCTMRKQVPKNIRPSNIGKQFDNVGTIIVFAATDIPVPKGAIGELCVSGKLVGNGYIQRPDLTAQNFVHSEKLGTKMYRTGDLVRLLPDLSFDFIGRKDTQVKLRGQRLEIGEINSVIKQSSEHVRDVVTLILKYSIHHSDQLVSFVAIAADSSYGGLIPASPSTNSFIWSVFNCCKSKLPMYMVPTYILPLQNIPLSINNKIDNEALAKLYTEATPEMLGSYSEQNLSAELWNKVEVEIRDNVSSLIDLRSSSIGLSTTFFELGFDSVSLVSLLKRLRKFYSQLTMSTLMRFPSIQRLAKHILENDGVVNAGVVKHSANSQNYGILNYRDQACCELDLNSEDIEYIIPCTPLQEGMIACALSSENDILYFNKFFFELYEEVDISRLQQCWNAVVQQNQALRVSFFQTEGGVVQVILKDWTPVWLDYTNAIGDYRKLAGNLLTDYWKNVKLSRPPLIFSVMSTGQSRLLFMGLFHALYDGTSMQTILNDVVKLYFYIGVPNRPSFVEALYRIQSSVDMIAAKEFWTEKLSSIELKQSPKLQKSAAGSALTHTLCSLPYSKIQEGARYLRCTPQVLLQTAFAISLSRLQGTAVSFGLVVSGRLFQDDLDDVAGPLFNTLPLAIDISAFRSYRAIVGCLQEYSAQMMQYIHTPLRMIRKWLNVSPETDVFNALFVFQNTSASETEESLWKSIPSDEYLADEAICFEVECSHELLNLTLGYLRSYIDDELAQSFLQYVDVTVNNIIREPDGAVDINCKLKQVYSDSHCQNSNKSLPPTDYDATDSAVLEELRRSVAKIARIEKTEVQDEISIFRYGLDSIDAIRLSASLAREAIDLPLRTILKHPSIRSMSQALANTPDLRDDAIAFPSNISVKCDLEEAAPHSFENCEDVYYCTPLQDGILTESLFSENAFYVNHVILLVEEHVDFDRLKCALLATLNSNAIYRSKFVSLHQWLTSSSSHFGMAVLKESAVDFGYKLVRDSTWASELQSISNNISKRIDPFRSPPVHLQIIESETKRAIVLTMSHALYDGHSMGLFFSDVYEAYERSRPIPRPHFELLLSRIIAESQGENHINYWRAQLRGSCIEDFPDLNSRTDGTDRSTLLCRAEMSSKVSPQVLSVFAKRNGITFQTIGQTCWAILLSYYLGLSDVVFGTVLTGRTTEEDEQVQFPSMVTIPIRASIRGSFSSMLRRMQHYVNTSRDHQYTALSSIFQAVSGGRRLFHTLFIYQRRNIPIHSLWQAIDGWSAVEYTVATEFEQLPKSMTWRVATKTSKVGQESAEALVQQLDTILRQMLQSPESCNYYGSLDSDDGLSLSSLVQLPYGALRHMINGKTIGGSTTLEGYEAQENLRVCVAENHSRIVMRGCIGELCVVENANDEIKLIPTGVRARVLASGELKYSGLVEDIVSFDGHTLDLEKISHAVCGSSADIVRSRSLVAKTATKDIIVTFIISNSDQAGTILAAFRHARKVLDERVLPSYIISLRSISLREEDIFNGNILLDKFRNIGLNDLESFTYNFLCSGEWSCLEISLRKVLALVSGIDEAHIRKTDSIFHLGLDSISCIKLSNLLRTDNIFLSVGEIVACESIESMAQLVEFNQHNLITTHTIAPEMRIQQYVDTERLSSEFGITSDMIQMVLPATPGQVYMLSGWQTSQDVAFISTFCYYSELRLDRSAMECAWFRLLEDLPVLRTTFIATECADFPILQLILKPESVTHTLSCSPGFDSKSDAFFETVPVHLHISGHKIYLTIHHALYDAWSLRLIVSSLSDLYHDGTKSATISLDAARNEFVSRVNCPAESKREFWTSQLRDASTVDHTVYTSVRHGEFQLDVLISAPNLSSFCRKQGFSISSLLFAAYAAVYHTEVLRSSSNEVVFGVYNSGRTENITGLPDLVYPTLNIHPLAVCVKPSLRVMAHDIQKTMLEINKESRSQVSLFDIKRWTGVSVNSAVNFLDGVGDVAQQKIGIFDHVSDETFDAKGAHQNGKQLRRMIDKNLAKDAVKVNFDVELSLSNNKLNIGLFYREQALTGSAGKDFIARIAEVLENELTNH
ncbi:uncharacterized protein V1513DRAFT_462661 [Lipomyces chichibuensis]|uniref:uncharacterized protein n=1 Tax=Lipomyces chichibuensis TaxID=1546026 RepID=UPI003343090C